MSEMLKFGKLITSENTVSFNKHTRTLEYLPNRDAVHIAVCQVIATEWLAPGAHVGFPIAHNTTLVGKVDKPIGIIDPYLHEAVNRDDRCWMFLYPQTVTSLRHEWTHPAFDADGLWFAPKDDSEKWLQQFALAWGMDYDEMITEATTMGYLCARDRDIHSWSELQAGEQDLFWTHLENVTGRTFDQRHRENTGFSCSC